jgi:hypothetical protein
MDALSFSLSPLPPSLFPPRGYVYCSQEIEPGWMVWTNGRLLHRPKLTEDKDGEIFCSELDSTTLKVWVFCTFELKFYTIIELKLYQVPFYSRGIPKNIAFSNSVLKSYTLTPKSNAVILPLFPGLPQALAVLPPA